MILVDDFEIEISQFPAGESHIKFPDELIEHLKEDATGFVEVQWAYKDDSDLFTLASVVQKLREFGVSYDLIAPYLPHARMDRTTDVTQNFALDVLVKSLKTFDFEQIISWDVHSEVAKQLMHSRVPQEFVNAPLQSVLIESIKENYELPEYKTCLIFPDETAYRRFESAIPGELKDSAILICDKKRDFETGKILKSEARVLKSTRGFENGIVSNAIIVDDICSYGGTFNLAIEEVSKKFPQISDFYLSVTHLEKSFFEGKLKRNNKLKAVTSFATLDWSAKMFGFGEIITFKGEIL